MPIFDQGYQHWSGTLTGHVWRPLAIARRGVRGGMKGLLTRLVFLIAVIPPLLLGFTLCIWGLLERNSAAIRPYIFAIKSFIAPNIVDDPKHYRVLVWTLAYDYFLKYEVQLAMILILMVGPNLISLDLRFNALPLYLSRPLRRIDYFLGKFGIIAAFMAMVMILPSIIAYVLGFAFSLDFTILRDTFRILLASVFYGVIVTLSAGTLVLALSALSRNSRYISLLWLGVWLVTLLAGIFLQSINEEQQRHSVFRGINDEQRQLNVQRSTLTGAQFRQKAMALQIKRNQAWQKMQATIYAQTRRDWRPLVSYTDNLARIRRELLGTDAQWTVVGDLAPDEDARESFLENHIGSQYPWFWSGAVLLGLFGFSVCMLHYPIRSLDRLK